MITADQARKLRVLARDWVECELQAQRAKIEFTSYGRRDGTKTRSKEAKRAYESYVAGLASHVTGYEYRFVNDLGGWSAWQPISRADYERDTAEPVKGREVRAVNSGEMQ